MKPVRLQTPVAVEQFQIFLAEIDRLLAQSSEDTNIYQMSFELFDWGA